MRREIGPIRALANALAAFAVIGLAGYGVVQVAGRHWQWQETFRARAEFASVAGVEPGGSVRVQGVDAGVIESVVPPDAPGKPVTLVLRIDARLRPLVRADSVARIVPQGVVGAKVVELAPGSPSAPELADGGTLQAESPRELADLMADAATTLKRLDAVAAAAEQGLGEVNAIAQGVRNGEGTLGRLVQDEEAYERLVALSDRGEDALGDLEENLAALKQTWPLSRYFDRRGFDDRDRVLYQPSASRESQVLPGRELFAPGRAVLTPPGRDRLDEVARWFAAGPRPKDAQVVVAAFTDSPSGSDEDLAQILTQERAEAVRTYLVDHHKIQSNGWLRRARRVAAVGFGTQSPRVPAVAPEGQPADRVEVIVFSPQG